MHADYEGACNRCRRHKGEFNGKLPGSVWDLREEIVRSRFPHVFELVRRKVNFWHSGFTVYLCDKCWELWRSPVRVNWRKILKDAKPNI